MSPRPMLVLGDSRAVLSGFTPEPVSLAALISSGIAIEWHEGIALIQEAACRALEAPASHAPGELSDASVRIDLSGSVFIPRGGVQNGPAAVSQLGGLLRDLLRDNMPVPLRLAISQAMSNPPYYASIKSFSDALAYFERPDRTNIIRSLYQRWESHARGHAAPQHHKPAAEREQAPPPAAPKKPRAATSGPQRWIVVAGSIAVVLTLALVLVAVWIRNFGTFTVIPRTESAAPLPAQPAETSVAESPAPKTAVTRATAPQGAPAPTRTAAPASSTTTPPIQIAPSESERVVQVPVTAPAPGRLSEVTQQLPSQAAAIANHTPSPAVQPPASGSQIYSALDPDVAAPVAEYPQTSSVATVMDNDEMLTFDLVIDQTGKVESVKLRHAPRSIRGTLMLTMSMSVAKAWRFQPATRQGQSVKYRQSVSVPAPQ